MIAQDLIEKDVLNARLGGFFAELLDDPNLWENKTLLAHALDALEGRIQALELRGEV